MRLSFRLSGVVRFPILVALCALLPASAAQAAKVAVCHKPGAKQKVLSIAAGAVAEHLGHGDRLVSAETCNGVDDDCDGAIDEGLADLGSCTAGVGECAVEGALVCTQGASQCDAEAAAPPENPETSCGDGKDNDCDGYIDCVDSDCAEATACVCPAECVDGITTWKAHDFDSHSVTTLLCHFDEHRVAGAVHALTTTGHVDQINVSGELCSVSLSNLTILNMILTRDQQRACAPLAAQAVEEALGVTCDISPP
jgi:hypothetical protein